MRIEALTTAILLLTLQFFTLNAQEIQGVDAQENLFQIGGAAVSSGVVRKFDHRYEGIKGSPFYVGEWLRGSISLADGQKLDFVEMKYNAYEDELIIKKNSSQYYFPKDKIISFTLYEHQNGINARFVLQHHYKHFDDLQFYRIVSEGKTSILELTKVIFEKADFQGAYSNDKRYDEFKQYAELYYFNEVLPQPKKLKRTTKGISSLYAENSMEIKKFILDNGYNCRNEDDLLKILSYIQNIE